MLHYGSGRKTNLKVGLLELTYFFRLSLIPIVVSPIIIPIGFVSGFGCGVVLLTLVSESGPLLLPFAHAIKIAGIATINNFFFMRNSSFYFVN